MRQWAVASAIVESTDGLLLVANRRRDGRVDWSPPGGVIDAGESPQGALAREVREETGLEVLEWSARLYSIEVEFVDLEWHLEVEVHRVASWQGVLNVEADPDGIVFDAAWSDAAGSRELLAASPRWVAEPVCEWLDSPWAAARHFGYEVRGGDQQSIDVVRR